MKNQEIKTKKMSLVNLENNLTSTEMENIMAGSGFLTSCGGAMVGGAIAYAGFFFVGTSVIGAGVAAAGFIYTSAQIGATCGYR